MRIIGGTFGGRVLKAPHTSAIRPTSDRMRETLFNILTHRFPDQLENAQVLDLFAGTGALSFEALSRGARFAVLVDIGAEARGLLRENIEILGLGGMTRLFRRDATKLGDVSPFEQFTLIFCDPPYGKGLGETALASALRGGWIAPNALIVLEERAGLPLILPAPLMEVDRREAGETQFIFGKMPPLRE